MRAGLCCQKMLYGFGTMACMPGGEAGGLHSSHPDDLRLVGDAG
jgi:hypothetical protein